LVVRATASTLDAALEDELLSVAVNASGPDAAEGQRAFASKRAADFNSASSQRENDQ
jgi:enoyl-CoA hydratase/carnithine racemase